MAADAPRWRVVVAYDGTDFSGFQQQARHRSVQAALQEGLLAVTGQPIRVHGAGRTDAGVHASGQVVHFDSSWSHGQEALQRAWNAALPRDVAVAEPEPAPPDFHARHSALSRTYTYTLLLRTYRDPLLRRQSLLVVKPLDKAAMAAAAQQFRGAHDFAAFGQPMRPGAGTVREILGCALEEEGELLRLRVEGNAFLRHQVRRMVGVLLDVGRGQTTPPAVTAALSGDPGAVKPRRVPPQGLVLVGVSYPPDSEIQAPKGRGHRAGGATGRTGDHDDDEDLYS